MRACAPLGVFKALCPDATLPCPNASWVSPGRKACSKFAQAPQICRLPLQDLLGIPPGDCEEPQPWPAVQQRAHGGGCRPTQEHRLSGLRPQRWCKEGNAVGCFWSLARLDGSHLACRALPPCLPRCCACLRPRGTWTSHEILQPGLQEKAALS